MPEIDLGLVRGKQGNPGTNGEDATINGFPAINIIAGKNISIDQSVPGTLEISASFDTGGFIPTEEKGAVGGVATLGPDGKLAEDQRPNATGMGAADRSLSNLTDHQTALYNLGAGAQPNHLINGDFTVNQEKWTGTPSAENQKIHDMWVLSWTPGGTGHAYALTDGGVSITSESVVGNDPGGVITNKFEEPIDGEWTLSVLMKIDSLPAGSYIAIQIANDTKQAYPGYSINSEAAQMEKYAIYTLTANISGWEASDVMRVSVYNCGGPATFSVKSVKLEPGAKQTHARLDGTGVWKRLPQPDEDYAVQLAKCQRYYQLYSGAAVRPNSPIDCRPVMRTPTGGRLTQGTIVIDGVTYYYNSAEL